MPSRSQLPGNINRTKLLKSLKRQGFIVDMKGGSGSHCKIIWPKNEKSITIPKKVRKDVLYYLLKEIVKYSNITWDDIKKNM